MFRSPRSLSSYRPIVFDGKAIKKVAKRLKPLRGASGGLLGGRTLVALDVRNGLALAMHGHPDGDLSTTLGSLAIWSQPYACWLMGDGSGSSTAGSAT